MTGSVHRAGIAPGTRRHFTAWSGLALALGLGYVVSPIDLLTDPRPWVDHADEAGVMLAAVAAAFLLAAPARHAAPRSPLPAWLQFRIRVLRADLGNFFFIQHRHVDGFLVTAKNSGSHWLKFMLSAGLAHKHGLALPAYSTGRQADSIIGHPKGKARIPGVKLIGTTHTIPSALTRFIPGYLVRQPPIVVMVRDIPAAMLSNYNKWRLQYPSTTAEFAAGDPSGRRFIADAWWYVHFFNRWGAWAAADPARIMLLRYEDLMAEPALFVARAAAHLGLAFSAEDLAAALAFTGKDAIGARQDPDAGETIVPDPQATRLRFSAEDEIQIAAILRRYLKCGLGYAPMRAGAPALGAPGLGAPGLGGPGFGQPDLDGSDLGGPETHHARHADHGQAVPQTAPMKKEPAST